MARKDKQSDREYNHWYYVNVRTKEARKIAADRQRKSHLKIAYGITAEDYDRMYNEQQGRCAICGKHQSELKRKLHVDHNHITGKVRGLLCMPCNSLLGYSYDNAEILKNAIAYLGEE